MPLDLRVMLVAFQDAADPHSPEIWWQAVHRWLNRHDVRMSLDWLPDLARTVSEAERTSPADNDARWQAMRTWLEAHHVPVPDTLPDPQ